MSQGPPSLRFAGGAGTVTGSKYLLTGNRKVLLECGLFQGLKSLCLRNWADRLRAYPVVRKRS
jgi:metallo-beta-lactamase family protein